MNIAKLILLLITFFLFNYSWSQKYSIDDGKIKKSGKIGMAYKMAKYREQKPDRAKARMINKQYRSANRARRKSIKRIQTKSTQKEMKELHQSAKRINNQKPPEYLFHRMFRKVSESANLSFIKIKLFVFSTTQQFKSNFRNNTTFEKNKKKEFNISN